MSKNVNINTEVDPVLMAQAQAVLNELGLSMTTAMSLFLKQVILHNGIPFAITLPKAKPVALEGLSEEEFNRLMEQSLKSYESGQGIPFSVFEKQLAEDIGV